VTQVSFCRLQFSLAGPLPAPVWLNGIRPGVFTSRQAPAVHALLQSAYANGGGAVAPFGPWWSALAADREYDPALCFVAQDAEGALVGVAQCWTSAFVKDLAVHPLSQRRGIGRALMLQVFQAFRQRGSDVVALKVEADNDAAIRFYRSLGMSSVEQA
jgi:ribosomal protein S18 acetylase RimI-like enzyme